MVLSQIQRSAFLASVLFLVASPAWAEVGYSPEETGRSEAVEAGNQEELIVVTDIPQLSELDRPATTVTEWLAQSTAAPVQITGVQLNSTLQGLELQLETIGELVQPAATSIVGNTLIVNIDNATLALPDGDEFESANPVEGIALITVTSLTQQSRTCRNYRFRGTPYR